MPCCCRKKKAKIPQEDETGVTDLIDGAQKPDLLDSLQPTVPSLPEIQKNLHPPVRIVPCADPGDPSLRFKAISVPDGEKKSDGDVGWMDTRYLLWKAFDITESCVSPDGFLVCFQIHDERDQVPLVKVSHRIGVPSVTICSPTGILIGESISEIKLRCCSIRPRYTLLSRFGKQLLVLDGKVKCCPPGFKVKIKTGGQDCRDLAIIMMSTLSGYSGQITFLAGDISDHTRNLIFGMSLGLMLQSQDARASRD